MRKLWLLGLSLVFLMVAGCGTSVSETVTEEEYAVYAAAIEQLFLTAQSEMVVVRYETAPQALQVSPAMREKIATYAPEIDDALLDELEQANQQSYRLDGRIPLGVKALIRPSDELDALLQKNEQAWNEFYALYPTSPGVVTVSRAVFDRRQEQAVVYVTLRSGMANEAAYFLTLQKENDLWRVMQKFPEWLE